MSPLNTRKKECLADVGHDSEEVFGKKVNCESGGI